MLNKFIVISSGDLAVASVGDAVPRVVPGRPVQGDRSLPRLHTGAVPSAHYYIFLLNSFICLLVCGCGKFIFLYFETSKPLSQY